MCAIEVRMFRGRCCMEETSQSTGEKEGIGWESWPSQSMQKFGLRKYLVQPTKEDKYKPKERKVWVSCPPHEHMGWCVCRTYLGYQTHKQVSGRESEASQWLREKLSCLHDHLMATCSSQATVLKMGEAKDAALALDWLSQRRRALRQQFAILPDCAAFE